MLSPWWRICQLSLNRATASAWIKGFLLAVVISGTYDMLSIGWLTLRSSSQSSHSSGWFISKESTLDFKYDSSKPQAKSAFHSYTQQQAQLPLTFLIVGSIYPPPPHLIIFSAKEIMFSPVCFLSVSLFVSSITQKLTSTKLECWLGLRPG